MRISINLFNSFYLPIIRVPDLYTLHVLFSIRISNAVNHFYIIELGLLFDRIKDKNEQLFKTNQLLFQIIK